MAIGTTAAILGSAVIGAGASAMSAKSSKKAIGQATDAQVQAARENNALTREIYDTNRGILRPFYETGYAANDRIGAMLGLSGDPVATRSAFDAYRGSTGYDFRVSEGMKGLDTSFAARGLGNSGAAAKAALTFGQNIASDEFGNYMGYLTNERNAGLGAASALAGVGQNFANTVSANNNAASAAIANGALARGNNTNAMWGNIAGFGGQAMGALSSYAPMQRGGWSF